MRSLLFFIATFFWVCTSLLSQEMTNLDVIKEDDRLRIFIQDQTGNPFDVPILDIQLSDWLTFQTYEQKIKERYGFFKQIRKKQRRSTIQKTDSVSWTNNTIFIQGSLSDGESYICQVEWINHQLKLTIESSSTSYRSIKMKINREKDSHFWGAGQQHSYVRLNGRRIQTLVQEQGIGAGDQPVSWIANTQMAGGSPSHSYAPIPYLSDNYHRGILVLNTESTYMDLRKKGFIELEVTAPEVTMQLLQEKSSYDLINQLTSLTGRPRKLPDWVWGNILGMQGGKNVVDSLLELVLQDSIPVDAVWIQDWVGRNTTFVGDQLRWDWIADSNRYPDLRSYIQSYEHKGIKLLGYINPMFITSGRLYQEGDSLEYFVKDHHDKTYVIEMTGFNVGLLDLTHPDACSWMKEIIKNNLIENGFKGWMADFGEALPFDAVMHDGRSAESFHNAYPVQWAKLNKEAIEEVGKQEDIAFFSRSGYTGGTAYSSFYWIGDQMTSWQKHDGIPSIVKALLSSGLSGMSINHADIGGFAGFYRLGGLTKMIRTPKLLKRHIELACLSPIFRTHEGILPDHNAQVYDDDIRSFYLKFAQIRNKKRTYLMHVAQEAYEKGYPMVRHLRLEFPLDKQTWSIEDQFLLGDSLLIAPILTKRNKRRVYLPKGKWRHMLTGKYYNGASWYLMKAPIGQPCYFERIGI